jgi:hypothetical protein
MTTLALTFMLISVSFVTVLMVWCFARVLRMPTSPAEEIKEFHSA